jgi:hypothetical protein
MEQVDIVCVEGITVLGHMRVPADTVEQSLDELNRAMGAGIEWRLPIIYRDDRMVCQACAQVECCCPATRSELRAERFVAGYSR